MIAEETSEAHRVAGEIVLSLRIEKLGWESYEAESWRMAPLSDDLLIDGYREDDFERLRDHVQPILRKNVRELEEEKAQRQRYTAQQAHRSRIVASFTRAVMPGAGLAASYMDRSPAACALALRLALALGIRPL